jgi:hypothetical protein
MAKLAEIIWLADHRAAAGRRARALEDAARAVQRMADRLLKETARMHFRLKFSGWIDREPTRDELLPEEELEELGEEMTDELLLLLAHAREVAEGLRNHPPAK